VCSKDEHASIGVAENKKDSNAVFENSIGVLRTSAWHHQAMMLAGNILKRFWQLVVSHAGYLNNIVSPSRGVIVPKPSFKCISTVAPMSVEFHQLEPSALSTLIVASSRINPSASPPSKEYSSASLATRRSSDMSSLTANLFLLHEITLPLILSHSVPFQA